MRMRLGAVLSLVLAACSGRTLDRGRDPSDSGILTVSAPDATAPATEGGGSSANPPPNCHGSGAMRDASTGVPIDAMAQPQSCSSSTDCTAPDVCNVLPGKSTGQCGASCQSDCDCPAWLMCQGGVCTQCSPSGPSCSVGQWCQWAGSISGRYAAGGCVTIAECGIGDQCGELFAPDSGQCRNLYACQDCPRGGTCPNCASNSQCSPGQVCVGGTCVTCTSDTQCGPGAKCQLTHVGSQCTCSMGADCGSGQVCASGICTPAPLDPTTCNWGEGNCPTGQACIHGVCGPCGTFEDCNWNSANTGPGGLTCVSGVCTNCASNGQCGGGQACVLGTCGACVSDAQCGRAGHCTSGYCTCTTDADCDSTQRCGAGVCVTM
jgi:hypothetical protein